MPRKNAFSGDGEVLPAPHANSDVEARLRFFVQGYFDFTKEAAETYVRKCMLVREAEEDLPPEAVKRFFESDPAGPQVLNTGTFPDKAGPLSHIE